MSLRINSSKQQQGAASIEFAFMFVLVFMLFYGMVGYFIPLLLGASYQSLSSDILREAVSLQYSTLTEAEIQAQANRTIASSWLPAAWAQPCAGYSSYLKQDGNTWSACIRHADPSAILPPIRLFGWDLPPLPDEIRGEATVQLY